MWLLKDGYRASRKRDWVKGYLALCQPYITHTHQCARTAWGTGVSCFCGIIKEWVIPKCVFQSRFSIEADMALFPQNHLWQREQNLLFYPNLTPRENVSVWLVFKVFFSQYWKITPDLSKYSALCWPWGLVVFNSHSKESATLTLAMCQLQVWTSTLSLAVKLTTRRVSPPPEKQISTSKVKLGLSAAVTHSKRFSCSANWPYASMPES